MGKSIRCKIKKRLRTVKRQRVDAMVETPRVQEHYEALRKVAEGQAVTFAKPRNAFKFPKAEDAVFPQHLLMKPIDFRAANLPMAGYVFRNNRRKYAGDQAKYMEQLAKTSHPKMVVLAGGGAVLAATGQKVSLQEAQVIATAVQKPEAAAAVGLGPSAASAVAAAVAEAPAAATPGPAVAAPASAAAAWGAAAAPAVASSAAAGGPDVEMAAASDADGAGRADGGAAPVAGAEPEPLNTADHTRRPVLKDERRAKRAAAHRPRAKNAAKGQRGKDRANAGKTQKTGKTKGKKA